MSNILVSIICTNYNKGEWIRDAIESFLKQKTDFAYEVIVIDDASADDSPSIIREYAAKYPDKIRAYYNNKNLGITKTWVKICKEAKGRYIARCDGDDFWIDNSKLQKQVELLERTKGSEWCTTDYDMVSLDGKTTHKSAVETGFLNRPDSYAEMLAAKGMTMASTWLVGTELMQKINADINQTAVDDTFNIQLDLFMQTKLTYLPQATTAYRMNEGSDSKPTDAAVARKRDERLLDTQLEYLARYEGAGYKEIIEILLRQGPDIEERMRALHSQNKYVGELQRTVAEKDEVIRQKDEVIRQKDEVIASIVNSKRYKIGKIVVAPVSAVKHVTTRSRK